MADLRVLIVESDEFLRQALSSQINGLAGMTVAAAIDEATAGQRAIAQHQPDVLVLEVPDDAEAALDFADWLRIEQPEIMVVGATANARPDLLRQAMRCGVQDILPRPIDAGQLKLTLDHARELKTRRLRAHEQSGRVTAVMGVSGGIGTTTIATNLAVAMARSQPEDHVVLADFDLMTGNIPCFLDLHPQRTYQDLLADMEKLDSQDLQQLLPRHGSGLFMLAGPQTIEDLDAITHEDVARTIDLCRSSFKQVIVDAGHGLDERRIELLDRVDLMLLVVQQNVSSVHRACRVAETLGRLGYPEERVQVIANRVTRGSDVTLEAIAKSVRRSVSHSIPNDYKTVINAIDTGVPLIEGKRSNRVAASIRSLSDQLMQTEGQETGAPSPTRDGRSPGPLGRLLSQLKPGRNRDGSDRMNGSSNGTSATSTRGQQLLNSPSSS